MPRKKQPAIEPPQELLTDFYLMLPDQENRGELNRCLTGLAKRRGVDLPAVYVALRNAIWAALCARQDARWRDKLERKDHPWGATQYVPPRRSTWLTRRARVLKMVKTLAPELIRLYRDADEALGVALRQAKPPGTPEEWVATVGRSVTSEVSHTLSTFNDFLDAVQADPVLRAQFRRSRGQQPKPWLKEAEKALKKAGVPKAAGETLLRLIGLKPYPSS